MTIATVPATVPDLLGTAPADLIDQHADQPVATLDVARKRAERIRARLFHYAEMRQDIADAFAQRDWQVLDYPTWHAYVEGEFGEELRALTRAERREAVADLRSQGMSTRQIAEVTGQGQTQVVRDLRQVNTNGSPATVTGSDGKQHPATKPRPVVTPSAAEEIARVVGAGPVLPDAATHVTPVQQVPVPAAEPERPAPPAWDPAERAAHEADVRKRRDIEAAHRAADRIVAELETHVLTITAGYRYGETGLITPETIAKLRAAIDRLEAEL